MSARFTSVLSSAAQKSHIHQKHACMAFINGKSITPPFHNYNRSYMFGTYVASAHSEMVVVNYLVNSLWKDQKLGQCILQGTTREETHEKGIPIHEKQIFQD